MRQIKIIDKTKGYNLEMEKNQDLIKNLDKLKQYAENYNIFNNYIKESNECDDENDSESLSQTEVESLMPKYPDTFDDYLEMVMQYGLTVFFAPAFPLAALFALINNMVEIRSDAFKMCYLYQRPFGQRASTIGSWQVEILK